MSHDYPISRRTAWFTLLLLVLMMIFGLMDRVLIASVFPHLKSEWGLSDTQLGLLVSAVNWSMALFALPAAVLVDRWNKKKAIGLMATIWTLATVGCGVAANFAQMFCARILIGAGEGGYGPGGISMLSALFPARLRATVMGILNAAGTFGGVLGIALGGYIAARWGWRTAFIAVALPGFLLAIVFMAVAPNLPTVALEAKDEAGGVRRKLEMSELVRNLFATRSLNAVYVAGICAIYFNISLIAWLPTYFNRVMDMPMDQAAAYAAVILMVKAVGVVVGGTITDKLRPKGEHMLLLVPGVSILIASISYTIAFTSSDTQFFVALSIGAFLSSSCLGPLFAVSQAVVYPGLHATTVGVINVLWQLLGGMGPILTGVLSDRLGIQTAVAINAFVLALAAVVMFWGSWHVADDVRDLNARTGHEPDADERAPVRDGPMRAHPEPSNH